MSATNETGNLREMLTLKQVLELIPLNRSTVFRMEKEGIFPQGTFPTPRKKLWFRDDIIGYQRDLQDPNSEVSKAVAAMRGESKSRKGGD
jgi:prophage regulatory protein